jgi:hypothetical protein
LPDEITSIMELKERIESFAQLGGFLRNSLDSGVLTFAGETHNISDLIKNQQMLNQWFTPGNVIKALTAIANELTENNLTKWTDAYPSLSEESSPHRIGVIMAGNIPLVGFHDFLSVLITGNNIIAKTSSKDSQLIVFLSDLLCKINPGFREKVEFTEGNLKNFDAVIATGSDNSSRYFEYYFSKYPNIIRKNRNSIGIIEGNETDEQVLKLGDDIFSYFGLGCRNVSKLYLPKGYDLTSMTKNWSHFEDVIRHTKYANNYDFNKAVYLVNREAFFDTGHLLLKEDTRISSPVSVLFYEYYESQHAVKQITELLNDKIQCVVGKFGVPFGEAQSPHLWDYADGIDTIEFLLKKKLAGIL